MSDLCPGSGTQPAAAVDRQKAVRRGKVMIDCYGTCGYCRRDYYITSKGVLHVHRGLPLRPDGGLPVSLLPRMRFQLLPRARG